MSTKFHPLSIKDVQRETADCVSLEFEVPQDLKTIFQYKPGQYLTLRTTLNDQEIRRSYSLCSSPDDGTWRVAVKRMDGGKFSTYAQNLLPGTVLEVMPPMGNFTPQSLSSNTAKNYIALVAGSGITPVMGIMRYILNNEPLSTFSLVYGNKNRSSIIFRDAIEALKNTYMQRLSVYHLLSRESVDFDILNGRLTGDKVKALTAQLLPIQHMDEAFICGPEAMILEVRDELLLQGMPKDKVHVELFISPDEPHKQHEEWVEKVAEQKDVQSQVSVTLDGVTSVMDLAYKGDSILDAALKNGADLPYACKGGVCATCRAKLIEGAVDMEVNYSLTDEEVAKGYILTCQSHPKTKRVHVDFDTF